ncbi:MAG: diguanylate cyclase [Deltaproteobacteria bacterium]|nr:diguanylate cyclase [Deltaproteobacteria bacterium]
MGNRKEEEHLKTFDCVKILAVDDSDEILFLYEDLLRQSGAGFERYQLKTAKNAADALKLFVQFSPDVLILDVYLSGSSGLEICRQVRRLSRQSAYVGIMFITADHSPEMMNACAGLGSDDFCSKLQMPLELAARLRSVVRIKRMADSLRATNEKLRLANERLIKISITDELTGLYNMRYFKKRLQQEFTRAERYRKDLSLMMIDLDFFKRVNDQCDHLFGSFVLAQTGALLSDSIRSLDIAARFGGDEYVIMLPETNAEGAYIMAERIRKQITDKVFDNHSYSVQITPSIGLATMGPDSSLECSHPSELMREADHFLYDAKASGRNRVMDLNHSDRGRI